MAKNKKNRKRQTREELPPETQAADAMTIGWMLALLTSLICQVAAIAANWISLASPRLGGLKNFGAMLFFAATVIGLVVVALIPVLYKVRKTPPPKAIVGFAIVVAIAPWVVLLVQSLR